MRKTLKELRITYERKRVDDDLLNQPVTTSRQVYDLFREMENEVREKVICLHLSKSLRVLAYEVVGLGNAHEVMLDIPGIFRGSMLSGAHSIIIVHNHPSGEVKPSEEDTLAAIELNKMGALHQIPLRDFVIIGGGYYSFTENDLL